jgi:hypothetical protein
VVVLAIAKQVEDRETALLHDDGLAVDDAGLDGQACDGVHDQLIAVGEIIAVTGDEAYAVTVLPRQDTEAVVLNFVNPAKVPPAGPGPTPATKRVAAVGSARSRSQWADRRFELLIRHRQPVISSLSSSMSDNAMQRVPKVSAREVLRLIDQ